MTANAWPSIEWESRPWDRDPDGPRPSRRQLSAHVGTYRAAVLPPIARRTPTISTDVITDVTEATAELARFDAEHGETVLPFGPLLLRTESAASSQIENLTASAKAVLAAELGDTSRTNASLIVANTHAMQAALDLSDTLDRDAILQMHAQLLKATHPEWTGRWRHEQVWVGGTPWGPHQALFVPPHHTCVPAAMEDLVAFMARDDLPPLVQAAVAHAQFETIHPFPDGNGRVGRALVHAMLRNKDVTRGVTVPVSAGLLHHRDAYFAALDQFRGGDPEPIVARFVEATFHAVDSGRLLVGDLRRARTSWDDRVTARADAAAWRLADLLIEQPLVDAAAVRRRLQVSAPTAHAAIGHLVDVGVLTKVSGNSRNRTWAANDVLQALDAFAARARRSA